MSTVLAPTSTLRSAMRKYPRSFPTECFASSTRPITVAPRGIRICPSFVTASSSVPSKVSPPCADALDNGARNRIAIDLPSGNRVAAGTSDFVGETPLPCDTRSKGNFWALSGAFSGTCGCRPQPTANPSATKTTIQYVPSPTLFPLTLFLNAIVYPLRNLPLARITTAGHARRSLQAHRWRNGSER